MGYRVQRRYRIITQQDLPENVTLKDLKLPIDEITDERGNKIMGILVPTADQEILLYRDFKSEYDCELHSASKQVRSGQGKEIADYVRKEMGKGNSSGPPMPTNLRVKGQVPVTQADVDRAVEEAKALKVGTGAEGGTGAPTATSSCQHQRRDCGCG